MSAKAGTAGPDGLSGTTADVMVRALAAAGVQRIFAYPGDPIIEFMECARRHGIDVALGYREGTAAFMAEAHAMATGGIGTCVSTLGPGSTALVNGVAAATLDRVPMIAISGQIETARQAYFTHQVVEHEQLYRPVTKWAARVEAQAVATTMRKALRVATAERPGAVHLTCAADTFAADAQDATVRTPPFAADALAGQVFIADGATTRPETMLAAARRPVLLAGIGASRGDAGPAVLALAAAVQMPVVVAPMAKGVVPEDNEWFAGVLDMACNEIVWDLVRSADLVLAVGFDPVELIKPWRVPGAVVHIDTTPNTDQVYPSDLEIVGNIAAVLDALARDYTGQHRWTAAEVAAFRRRLRDGYYSGRVEGHLNPTDVVDAVRAAAPPDTLVTTDVGSHKLLVGQGWPAMSPRSVLMTNGLSAMGFGIPAAIAAKMALPDRPVVAMVGDGGFAMTATELRHAAARGLGLAVVVFVDGSLNRIELKQSARSYPSTATRIDDIDLVLMAQSMSCDGARAETAGELEKALTGLATLTRPLVIEARIDPGQYQAQF
ncbi:thiamine pyrophosphate-binding protein [Dactylosporangium sp. CA-092794]|uniref:thiamine pyrophosphate-binding protein n=1 Tax=Dactylosporangium sp. CA-092794 TaxID=3239929 RepID=UPI003D933C9D